MDGDQGGAVEKVTGFEKFPRLCGWCGETHVESECPLLRRPKRRPLRAISVALTTITATVTREVERSFTSEELAEAGGLAAAKAAVVLEAMKYGTVVNESVDARVVA